MSTAAPTRLLTLPDIAALAGVQRPVVSMWRRRTSVRGVVIPFPSPVELADGVEHFAVDDVLSYLTTTGRGRNQEAALDAGTLAAPVEADHGSAELLLTLAVVTGEDLAGLTTARIGALARDVDPGDTFLLREIAAGTWHPDLPDHVDELVAASLGPEDALDRLDGGRLARAVGHRGGTPELVDLIGCLAAAGRDHAGPGAALDPSGDAQLDRVLAPLFPTVLIHDGDTVEARRQRRRAAVLQWPEAETGDAGPVVRVRTFLGLTTDDVLRAVDDVVLDLRPGDVAVVLGPAAALTDGLIGDAERNRADTLRPGPLAAALRLPRGLWRAAHRQSPAVWVLTGGSARSVVRLADLDGVVLDHRDLATDITQALTPVLIGGPAPTEAHAYRYLRPRELAPVLAGGSLVPRGTHAVRLSTAGDLLDQAHAAAQVIGVALPAFPAGVTAGSGQPVVRSVSLGELAAEKRLTLRQGRRIERAEADPAGTVQVLSADGSTDDVRLDPFDARDRHPRATWTEPGDVVFLEKPHPRAVVDTLGGSLVSTPSRILRLAGNAPVRAHVLAEQINRAPAGSEWRTWEVPALPRPEATALDAHLAQVAQYRAELRRRERALDDWAAAVTAGVAAGSLAVRTSDPATAENR